MPKNLQDGNLRCRLYRVDSDRLINVIVEIAYPAVRPPSTGNATPLMNAASSLAR
jgi:hypothetical protein